MVSNDVAALAAGDSCDAMLLTPKARVIAVLRVWRRDRDDYLLLAEPELGARVERELVRARFAAKVEIGSEEHDSTVVLGDTDDGLAAPEYGVAAVEVVDADVEGEPVAEDELERLRIRAATPRHGRELDDRVLPAEAGLVARAVSLTKGCYPGQEPIARQHYRGRVNRTLRVLELDTAEPPPYDAEILHGEKVVGRVTSAVRENDHVLALGYVRVEVAPDADLRVGTAVARSI
jgi:folate-binding protein YgfZ